MKNPENNNKNLPKRWRKVKLGEIVNVSGGGTPSTSNPKYWGGNIAWLTPAEVVALNGNRFIDKTERYITEEGLKNSSAKVMPVNSLLLTSRATIGEVVINKIPMATNQGFINIEPKNVNLMFLFYWLKNNRKFLNQMAIGSTFNELSKSVFKKIDILIPEDPNEQKRIADILSAFDDKIEVNNKIIKTLEEMAQEIFKEWFLRFRFPGWEKVKFVDSELGKIPEGWQVKFLSEFFDFLEGPGIRNWQYTTSGCRFINIRLIQNNDIDIKSANFISTEEANGKYKHFHLQERDMIVSTSGTLGRSAIVRKEHLPLLLNTSVIRFRPKDKKNYGFMYQFLNSIYFQNKILSMASGSAQPNFGPVHLKQIKLVVPNKDILNLFSTLIDPVYEKIIILKSENQKLATMRDLLLPKLMRGEILIKN